MELDADDVVAPLENLTASALVASEGASLLMIGLKEKRFEFGAVGGSSVKLEGLSDGAEVVNCAPLVMPFWLLKGREFDIEDAGLKEAELELNGDSVSGLDEGRTEVVKEDLEIDGECVEGEAEGAWNWKAGGALSNRVPLTLGSSFLSKIFLNIFDVCEPGEAA